MKVKTRDLRPFITSAKVLADHHAPNINRIVMTLLGYLTWKQDPNEPFEIFYREDSNRTRSSLWAMIGGRPYFFCYSGGEIVLRKDNRLGQTIARFTNASTDADIQRVFEKLKPSPTYDELIS